MKIEQTRWSQTQGGDPGHPGTLGNEAQHSLTFAGDLGAAQLSYEAMGKDAPELAYLISCEGRKLVLKQRIEGEVEGVRNILEQEAILAGFNCYEEISPFNPSAQSELHNQTMTITTLSVSG